MSSLDLTWIKQLILQYKNVQNDLSKSAFPEDYSYFCKIEAADEILDLIKNYIKEINNVTNKPIEIKKND